MRKLTPKVSLAEIASCPESVWIADVAVIHSAGERFHCALVQDLKTRRVLGWAMANDASPSLLMRAIKVACNRSVRTRPVTLYLDSSYGNTAPSVLAELSCMAFQLRLIGPNQLFLLKPLEQIWRDLQARFTAAGTTPDNDDWFD